MRTEILQAVKDIIDNLGVLKNCRLRQKDWRTESEYPVAYVFMPVQSFGQRKVTGKDLSSLKGTSLVSIRIVTLNEEDDNYNEIAQIDTLMDTIMTALIQDSRLGNTVKTSDIIQTQTDGGVIITHSLGQIDLEVQI